MKFGEGTFERQIARREKIVDEATHGAYNLVGYVSCFVPAIFKHSHCGQTFELAFSSFIKNIYCRSCKSDQKPRKRKPEPTLHARKAEIEALGDFQLLSFVAAKSKAKILHITCGEVINRVYYQFVSRPACASCLSSERWGEHRFLQDHGARIAERCYEYLGGYKVGATKIEIRCLKCDRVPYLVSPGNFVNKEVDCPCRGRQSGKNQYVTGDTREDVRVSSLARLQNNFTKLGLQTEFTVDWSSFETASSRLEVTHIPCGAVWRKTAALIVRGSCKICSNRYQPSPTEYFEQVALLTEKTYECLDDYKTASEKLRYKHLTCGTIWKTTPGRFARGSGCPKCRVRNPKGERAIESYLQACNVSYEREYRISECRSKQALPFDFAVFSSEKELLGLIEFDGRQHFQPVEKFGGEEALKIRQRHDAIKTNYCLDNAVPLLRIAYTEFEELEKKLANFIKEIK